ncbi:MAG: adenylyl-sulfate kinase [Burkholderiales bacterium]|nr:adenylyl-sulfate kinase [Burkholderiales bacterium]
MTHSPRSFHTVWHHATVTRARREQLSGHKGAVVWFTGLSGAGKSTIAHAVEEHLHQLGCHTYVLDGDNVRHGLCGDLGFSIEDRHENIRRIGEMTKLLADAGIIVLSAFISPLRADRDRVRRLVGADFVEIYCRCPIEVCEARDVKGLYSKARTGEIKEFTGISSPYEEPDNAEIVINSVSMSVEESVATVMACIQVRGIIASPKMSV